MRKSIMTLIGFFLFLFGFLSIVLSMIGVQLVFMTWMDDLGRLAGFIIRMVMILAGIVLVALAQTDWEKERLESS
jgi:predicted transcriptional regulator